MINIAKSAGFCHGVKRAVNMLQKEKGNIVSLGPVVHNKAVIESLGVPIINSPDEANGRRVFIRAHGIPPNIEKQLTDYVDGTCPSVKKIHRLVEQSTKEGRNLIILGKENHPEVIGICGYGGDKVIISNNELDLYKKICFNKKYTIVAQTTFKKTLFDSIISTDWIKELDIIIHDTICSATIIRQNEAEELAKNSDIMIVLGDETSSNAMELLDICKKYCKNSYLFQSISQFLLQNKNINVRIGLTAGASTPPVLIKEAIQYMNDNTTSENNKKRDQSPVAGTQTFEEMLDESFMSLRTGDIARGTVIHIGNNEIIVNLGYKSDGTISRSEYTDDTTSELKDLVKIGDTFEVYILRVNDGDGNIVASKKRIDSQLNYKTLETAHKEKTPIKGKITDIVKGGLIANILGCKVFVPSKQMSNRYIEDLTVFKNQELYFNIIEFDRPKKRIIGSRRDIIIQEIKTRREELLNTLEVGQRIEGTVSRIAEFGAFVDLGGIDGLVHVSEVSWKRIKKVSEVLKQGDAVTVIITKIDKEKGKISLTMRDSDSNPWNNVTEKYPIGKTIEGKVQRLTEFGAFVSLEEGIDGLVHISQISKKRIARPSDVLKAGQIVKALVVDTNLEKQRISLSIKELANKEEISDNE